MRFDDGGRDFPCRESVGSSSPLWYKVRCIPAFLGLSFFFIHTDQKPQKITKGNIKFNLPRAKSFHNSPNTFNSTISSHNETHTFHHSGLRCRRPRHSKPQRFRHGYENGKCGNAHCTHFYTHCHVCCSSNYG